MINEADIIKLFYDVITCKECNTLTVPKLIRDEINNVPQPGYIGKNYEKHHVLFIAQNPGFGSDISRKEPSELAYMKALRGFAALKTPSAYRKLNENTLKCISRWSIVQKYFPLEECGLELEDIAYCNVVRCRTLEDNTPSVIQTQNCTKKHLKGIIDAIQPKVIVCIGKWTKEMVTGIAKRKSIPIDYISGDHSLSKTAIEQNKRDVAMIVKSYINFDN